MQNGGAETRLLPWMKLSQPVGGSL